MRGEEIEPQEREIGLQEGRSRERENETGAERKKH